MRAQMKKKINLLRDCEDEDFEVEKKSRIPKMPKKTQSLEGKESNTNRHRSSSKHKFSTTSMIPRPEWKNYSKKCLTPDGYERAKSESGGQETQDLLQKSFDSPLPATKKQILAENKLEEDFANFKKNVLNIPEYWTDAGHTVTNVLKNAVEIIKKQYPTADVEAFETELQNILKATEEVKQQIYIKTKDIVHQASQIYGPSFNKEGFKKEDIRAIAKKMEELKEDVNSRKHVFGNLLKCGTGLKQILEIEQLLKLREESSREAFKEDVKKQGLDIKTFDRRSPRRSGTPKIKMKPDNGTKTSHKKNISSPMQTCGDILKKDAKAVIDLINSRTVETNSSKLNLEDKSSQTLYPWNNEILGLENYLNNLNNQILELHQMCKDHISKFKSFNLQIKLRGVCNKVQNNSSTKEIQVVNDETLHFPEKNKLQYSNQDLESAIKQKDLDIQQKNKVINKQKKLLHIRDELIEMLKNRCNLDIE